MLIFMRNKSTPFLGLGGRAAKKKRFCGVGRGVLRKFPNLKNDYSPTIALAMWFSFFFLSLLEILVRAVRYIVGAKKGGCNQSNQMV